MSKQNGITAGAAIIVSLCTVGIGKIIHNMGYRKGRNDAVECIKTNLEAYHSGIELGAKHKKNEESK